MITFIVADISPLHPKSYFCISIFPQFEYYNSLLQKFRYHISLFPLFKYEMLDKIDETLALIIFFFLNKKKKNCQTKKKYLMSENSEVHVKGDLTRPKFH